MIGRKQEVDEVFAGKFTFRYAGLSPVEAQADGLLRVQLDHFYNSLILFGMWNTQGHPLKQNFHRKRSRLIR